MPPNLALMLRDALVDRNHSETHEDHDMQIENLGE